MQPCLSVGIGIVFAQTNGNFPVPGAMRKKDCRGYGASKPEDVIDEM
jgi:hypothetical protein